MTYLRFSRSVGVSYLTANSREGQGRSAPAALPARLGDYYDGVMVLPPLLMDPLVVVNPAALAAPTYLTLGTLLATGFLLGGQVPLRWALVKGMVTCAGSSQGYGYLRSEQFLVRFS
jgi:hypothetical protein